MLLFLLTLAFGVGGLGLLYETGAEVSLNKIDAATRGMIFARARDEITETCQLPDAAREPVRSHCVEGARFLLLFPECDAPCAVMARALLPRARK